MAATAAAMVVVAPASMSSPPELLPDELDPVDAVDVEAPLLAAVELLALLELVALLELEALEVEVELGRLLDELAAVDVDVEEDAPLLEDPPVEEDARGAKHLPPLQTFSPPQSASVWHGVVDDPLEHAATAAARPSRIHLAIFVVSSFMQPPAALEGAQTKASGDHKQ